MIRLEKRMEKQMLESEIKLKKSQLQRKEYISSVSKEPLRLTQAEDSIYQRLYTKLGLKPEQLF